MSDTKSYFLYSGTRDRTIYPDASKGQLDLPVRLESGVKLTIASVTVPNTINDWAVLRLVVKSMNSNTINTDTAALLIPDFVHNGFVHLRTESPIFLSRSARTFEYVIIDEAGNQVLFGTDNGPSPDPSLQVSILVKIN